MKNIKITISALAILFATSAVAQEMSQQEETAKETSKKSYTFYKDGKKIKNSVKITTALKQTVMTEDEEKGQVNQTRVIPPKTIKKMVEIDNDSDEAYDEVIEFSYISDDQSDFTLVSSNENLMVAVDDGKNLTIMRDMTISKKDLDDPKKAYVFTRDNGKKIEFYVESYSSMSSKKEM